MIELEDAVSKILSTLPLPKTERVALSEAGNRTLMERILAPIDLPPFDNSAMDGYAVRSEDVSDAGASAPARLRVIGRIAAGESFSGELGRGQCVRLFTGSPLPRGADAVVMQEDTRGGQTEVLVLDAVQIRENVRVRGGDVKRGATLVEEGDALTPGRLGLLAASGIAEVSVGKRPIVGLLATGSELREGNQPLSHGQIYESNRLTLGALAAGAGAVQRIYPLVPDSLEATLETLIKALDACDIVVTTGGASAGEMDFVKEAFERAGGELEFWKVAIRPGKPSFFGRRQGKYLFGLPGNPISAFVTFLLLVRPAILKWQGARQIGLPSRASLLGEALTNHGDRRHFARVRMGNDGKAYSAGLQDSHALSSFAAAEGLVDVPPGATLPAGAAVMIMRWGNGGQRAAQ